MVTISPNPTQIRFKVDKIKTKEFAYNHLHIELMRKIKTIKCAKNPIVGIKNHQEI